MVAAAPLLVYFWWCALVGSDASANMDFTLRAETVEALEGGPLVVKVALAYHGREATEVYVRNWSPNARVEVPRGWKYRMTGRFIAGMRGGSRRLAPGDEITEILRIHDNYSGIPSGKTVVTVTWKVDAPGKGDKPGDPIAELSVPLEIDIPPATSEHLAALRDRMERQLSETGLFDWDRRQLGQDILDTRHHALAPVAWKLIESPRPFDLTRDLIEFVAEGPEGPNDLDTRVAKLVADPGWPATCDGLSFLSRRKNCLSPVAWSALTEGESPWTRALTYVFFPEKCDKEWKAALFQDLHTQTEPMPSPLFEQLLRHLDDENFDVREQASRTLMHFGERAEAQLRHAQEGRLSPEVVQRVGQILQHVQEAKQPPECLRTLDWLRYSSSPEAGEILQVLTEGRPDAWLTQQAKAKLEEWKKDFSRPAP